MLEFHLNMRPASRGLCWPWMRGGRPPGRGSGQGKGEEVVEVVEVEVIEVGTIQAVNIG